MLIPVNSILDFHTKNLYCFYDTDTNKFIEKTDTSLTTANLPEVDGISMICQRNSNTVTIIGRNAADYVICNYNRELISISENFLKSNNIKLSNQELLSKAELPDISHIFKQDTFYYIANLTSQTPSSNGYQRKFLGGTLDGKHKGAVKFPLWTDNNDCEYEILYADTAKFLGIPCVNIISGKYSGKPCILSEFMYNVDKDTWNSFHHWVKLLNTTEMGVVQYLNIEQEFFNAMLLDYITNSADRHMKNLAICNGRLYPMFDNGRSFTYAINPPSAAHRRFVERNISLCQEDLWYRVQALNQKLQTECQSDESKIMQNNINHLGVLRNG